MSSKMPTTPVQVLIEINAQGDACGNGAGPCDHERPSGLTPAHCGLFEEPIDTADVSDDGVVQYSRCAACRYSETLLTMRLAAR
jgi:hypothetical protein